MDPIPVDISDGTLLFLDDLFGGINPDNTNLILIQDSDCGLTRIFAHEFLHTDHFGNLEDINNPSNLMHRNCTDPNLGNLLLDDQWPKIPRT